MPARIGLRSEERRGYAAVSNFERVYSWGFFVVAINSRLPARRWCKKGERDAAGEIVVAWEREAERERQGDIGSKLGKGRKGGCQRGMGLSLSQRGKAVTAEGMRLHTPPRGLPHSDSPIRMSK